MDYELKLRSGRVVVWDGATPEDAARRYVDGHRTEAVIATRPAAHECYGIFPYGRGSRIIEPGDPGWKR
jgi:hypothetical protein